MKTLLLIALLATYTLADTYIDMGTGTYINIETGTMTTVVPMGGDTYDTIDL